MIEVANLWVLEVSPLPVDYYSGRKSIDGRMGVATEPRRLGTLGVPQQTLNAPQRSFCCLNSDDLSTVKCGSNERGDRLWEVNVDECVLYA